jgi:hypothetical protein
MMDLSNVEEVSKRLKKLVKKFAEREGGEEALQKVGLMWREDE